MRTIQKKLMRNKLMQSKERGVAMFMAIFALLLLTAISAGFVFMANTETAINSNYRTAQQAYFGAKAGLEEARARITTGATFTDAITLATTPALPSATPNTSTAQVLYILNQRGSETIEPWTTTNPYFDDTLCKANYPGLSLSYGTSGVPCAATAPSGSAWYSSTNSILPGRGTADAFPVKWTRIALKTNRSSSPYIAGATTEYPFAVNAGSSSNDIQICWDGVKQIIKPNTYTNCATPPTNGLEYRPVYMLTSLAVLPNGSRRVLSMEVADDPPFLSNSAINSQDYVTLNGALTVDGYDSCSCKCSTSTDPKSGKTSEDCSVRVANTPYASACLADKYAIYSNSGVDKPSNSENITAGTDPPIAQNQTDRYDLDRMIDTYRNLAETVDVTLPTWRTADGATKNSSGATCASGVTGCVATYGFTCSGSPSTCGTQSNQNFGVPPALPPGPDPTNPVSRMADGTPCPTETTTGCITKSRQVSYVPGNLKLTSSAKGNGVLIVNGDLEINGGMEFYGLILVKGVVKFTGGGSDKTNIFGSVLAGQSSLDQVVLGGSASIKYNRCALLNTSSPQPPRMLNMKEMQF